MEQDNHIFQKLGRDIHPIRQSTEVLWDAHNIRITNRDDNTLFTITNERGTKKCGLTIQGNYVGHCVLGKYLVLFTSNLEGTFNYIYRIESIDGIYRALQLFVGIEDSEQGWNLESKIDAFGNYETDLIQKVYWIDGKHQPRVINIKDYELKYGEIKWGNNQQLSIINKIKYTYNSLNFVQELKLQEEIEVEKQYGDGMFAPGVIQYAFSYYNKYAQESHIFYTTPLQYISFAERGGSPEDKVQNVFKLTLSNLDKFEYVRIYSIHRTSIDVVPVIKVIGDIEITSNNDSYTFIDKGTSGYTIDAEQLLYIGGKELIPNCFKAKDGTLFVGNYTLVKDNKWLDIKEEWAKQNKENWDTIESNSMIQDSMIGEYYKYSPDLTFRGFKSNETYRCGVQFQYKDGSWTEPLFIDDKVLNTKFPYISNTISSWKSSAFGLSENFVKLLKENGYKKARACVVYPTTEERDIICQGILCPTVYNTKQRNKEIPYSASSWLIRPATKDVVNIEDSPKSEGDFVEFRHNNQLFSGGDVSEIQGASKHSLNEESESSFYVDENILTFHSPDIEFDTTVQCLDLNNEYQLDIIGIASLGSIYGDIDVETSSPARSKTASGFIHKTKGFVNNSTGRTSVNGGLIAGLFYNDGVLLDNNSLESDVATKYHMVYMWHRNGSVNNSPAISASDGTRSAMLKTKKISNLKVFNAFLPNKFSYKIKDPVLFNSEEMELKKVWVDYLQKAVPYYGNVDTLIIADKDKNAQDNVRQYPLYVADTIDGKLKVLEDTEVPIEGEKDKKTNVSAYSSDPIRMRYKSTPHIVFSLNGTDNTKIRLLPTFNQFSQDGETYKVYDNTIKGKDPETARTLTYILKERKDMKWLSSEKSRLKDVGKIVYFEDTGNFYECKLKDNGKREWEGKDSIQEGNLFVVVGDGNHQLEEGNTLVTNLTDYVYERYGLNGFVKVGKHLGDSLYFEVKKGEDKKQWILEKVELPTNTRTTEETHSYTLEQDSWSGNNFIKGPIIAIAELRNINNKNKFNGKSEEILRSQLWLPAGDSVSLIDDTEEDSAVYIPFTYGDTWYGRYDCIKTYPFTHEDQNQVIEIGSFMCESRINIDSRYDRNRGQLSNLNMSPINFNKFNEVYNQKDNYFNFRILQDDFYKQSHYANQLTWSLAKNAGEDIDTWTNLSLGSSLDLLGDKGKITKLETFNNQLICLQDKCISLINFNSRTAIPVTEGVPIEISNSYKVDGYTLINDHIGCNNKWSVISTSLGVYFIDSVTGSLYLYNGQLTDLGTQNNMHWWFKDKNSVWPEGVRTFYDEKNRDVYFHIPNKEVLCYSEKLQGFTSFFNYEKAIAMCSLNDSFISIKDKKTKLSESFIDYTLELYENNTGDYNDFFGEIKGWDLSFISNQNPVNTKIFDTIELRADHYSPFSDIPLMSCPMNYIQVDNEYQDTKIVDLDKVNMRKKFRVWRGLIPRNYNTRQRIRNPWAKITLGWKPKDDTNLNNKLHLHDVAVKYTI